MPLHLFADNQNIPSVSLARPPVGWQRIVAHPAHTTTPCA